MKPIFVLGCSTRPTPVYEAEVDAIRRHLEPTGSRWDCAACCAVPPVSIDRDGEIATYAVTASSAGAILPAPEDARTIRLKLSRTSRAGMSGFFSLSTMTRTAVAPSSAQGW